MQERDGLPIIRVKVQKEEILSLLDSGASVSLVSKSAYERIKNVVKVNKLSRSIKLTTVTKEVIEFEECVEFAFQVGEQKCKNVFFVTKHDINSTYDMILGYDFLRRQRAILDVNRKIIKFEKWEVKYNDVENKPGDSRMERKTQNGEVNVTLAKKLIIAPKQTAIATVHVPTSKEELNETNFHPIERFDQNCVNNDKIQIVNKNIRNSEVKQGGLFTVQVKNNSNEKIHLNKSMKVGEMKSKNDQCIESADMEKEKKQKNNMQGGRLSLEKIIELRRQQLEATDFNVEHLDTQTQKIVLDMVMKNAHVFSKSYETLGRTEAHPVEINLAHDFPILNKAYPVPKNVLEFAKKEIDSLLKHGLIERSQSSYGSPVLWIPKRSKDGVKKWRMACDFRVINSLIDLQPIVLPKVKDVLNNIAGYKWYVSLDLKAAFYQQKILVQHRHKAAFLTPFGLFNPTVSAFGLKNSGNKFSALMNEVLGELNDPTIQFYLDDIVVAADDIPTLLEKLERVFQRLASYNLTIDPQKVQLCQQEITFLGFRVSERGIQPSEENKQKITDVRRPSNKKHVKSFLGLCNYFRFLIKNYAHIVEPLVQLTRPKKPFIWSDECESAWSELRTALSSDPVVVAPDMSKTFYLNTDASSRAIGALLLQKKGENYHIVHHFSRKLRPAEQKYPSFKSELLAIKEAVFYFREYLIGKEFVILSDARSLGFNLDMRKQTDVVARWLLQLSKFSYRFVHVSGPANPSDFLSREIAEDEKEEEIISHIVAQEEKMTNANIREKQGQDIALKEIVEILKTEKSKTGKYQRYKVNGEGILTIDVKGVHKICIPDCLRKHVIKLAHTAHPGIGRTVSLVTKFYFWRGLYKDIKNFVKTCHECMLYKNKNIPNNPPIQVFRPKYCSQKIALDLLGPFPKSCGGFTYILNIIDLYSRFVVMTPLKNILASTIVEQVEKYIALFSPGIETILSDNGTQFKSQVFADLLAKYSIKHAFASISYPVANSMVERSHSTIKAGIAAMTAKDSNWHINLRTFQLWYNCTKHSQTNYAPIELFLVRDIKHPMYPDQTRQEFESYEQFLSTNKEKREMIREDTMKQQLRCQQRQLENAKFVQERKFEVGQTVYLKNLVPKGVLKNKFSGPYIVKMLHKRNNVSIGLKDDPEAKLIKINSKKLIISPERFSHLKFEEDKTPVLPDDTSPYFLRSSKPKIIQPDEDTEITEIYDDDDMW